MNKLHVKLDIQRFAAGLSISSTVDGQDIAGNYSLVTITVTIKRTSGSTYWIHPNYRYLTINCDGQSYGVNTELPSNKTSVTYSHQFTVTHNNDGTKYIEYSASLPKTSSFPALSASGNATLPTIPRQPNYSWINATNVTETSVRLTAGIDTHGLGITASGWDVSPDGGTTWTYYANDPTDKTITGLLPNKQYWYRGYCATAGGGSNSGWGTFTTYDYPKANAVNDITLRQNTTFTIGFYNPFGKTFSYQIISNVDSSVIYTGENINTTSVTLNMNDLLDKFYETIPSAKEGTYYVKTTYNGNVRNSDNKKYTIDADTCKPIMSVVGYEDINSTTLALTGDNQKLIVGYSTIKVTVADGNKATPQYNATITGYKIKNGEYLSPIVQEVEGEDVILTCPATAGIIEVYAIDSREQTGIYQIVNTTMINYEPITKNQSPIAQRCDSHGDPNGVGEYVKITLSGEFWNNSFGLVTNSITSITYEYANAKTPAQTTPGTTSITETIDNDEFDVEQLILGDTSEGFDISNSYIINVTVSDELSSTTFSMTLASGTPHIAYSPNGVGIMGKYNEEAGGLLQVAGVPIQGGGGISGDTVPIGAIMPYSSSYIPENWLECNGQAVNRIDYADLFQRIGTTFGAGDGSTTFNVPNFNTRVPVGYDSTDTDFNAIGKTGGSKTHTQTKEEVGPHTHLLWVEDNNSGNSYGLPQGLMYWNKPINNWANNQFGITRDAGPNTTQPMNIMNPYITTKYIIKAFQSSGVIAEVSNTYSQSTTNTYSCNYINKKTGITLYSNNSGTTGDVTLSDSVENYHYIKILYRNGDGYSGTMDVMYPQNTTTALTLSYFNTGTNKFMHWAGTIVISGTTISHAIDYYYENNNGSINAPQTINYISILTVIGYK